MKFLLLIIINTISILFIGSNFSPPKQVLNQWSDQQRIPGYADTAYPWYLIADQNRTVHAFASQWVGADDRKRAITYNKWSLNEGWTIPVDILLSPLKDEARLLGAFLDQNGEFHVIFWGGDNTQANIYYSKAPAVNAGQASAWLPPVLVGENALDPEDGAIIGDNKGNLIVLFSGMKRGHGLYVIKSTDSGDSWSDPEPIYLTEDDQLYIYDLNMYSGQSGNLHVVWSDYDVSGNGRSVYYANYNFAQEEWSEPLTLVSTASGLPGVIDYDGKVIILYNEYGTNAFWMRESSDSGRTWTNPVRIAPRYIGRNGPASLVIDSNNVLHIFWGERIPGNPDIHGMWHSIWQGDYWTEPEAIVSGPQITDLEGDTAFDPYEAHAVISQGNVILVTWRSDPGNKDNGIWYAYEFLDAPELPVATLPSQSILSNIQTTPTSVSPASLPTFIPEPSSVARAEGLLTTSQTDSFNQLSLNSQLLIGILPVAILISVVWIYINHQRSRR